jgi:hypothetical protein
MTEMPSKNREFPTAEQGICWKEQAYFPLHAGNFGGLAPVFAGSGAV